MRPFVAALPMYDWPELGSSVDADWTKLRARLRASGIDAPESLARRNADLPPVSGGIRDGSGRLIARDPATLPPDEFDLAVLWRHPDLLVAQTCWGLLKAGLAAHVEVVGQPSYAGIEGGKGMLYSSAILMRPQPAGANRPAVSCNAKRERRRRKDVPAPADGKPLIPLGLIGGRRLAFNDSLSMSGILAFSRDLEALGAGIGIFGARIETGSHRASIVAVAEDRADVCAVDCRAWCIAQRHEPAANAVEVVGWTGLRKGLPMIASKYRAPAVLKELRAILSSCEMLGDQPA